MMFGLGKKAAVERLAIYMDPIEYSQLLGIVEAVHPALVLEWGSGGSTKALLDACPFIERWVSLEHAAAWHERVAEEVKDPRLSLHLIGPDEPLGLPSPTRDEQIAFEARAEHDPALFAGYVAFPRSLGVTFDLVLVDGRARRFCVREGYELLRPGGVLVLHDAQREAYHDAIRATGGRAVFLTPWKAGQIALVYKV